VAQRLGGVATGAEEFLQAGDKVVAVMRQRGRSKTSGMHADMSFAQVWTVRDGLIMRMQMYADPQEALEAVGLAFESDKRSHSS
jgi:ketosteroid isomerase-like protein